MTAQEGLWFGLPHVSLCRNLTVVKLQWLECLSLSLHNLHWARCLFSMKKMRLAFGGFEGMLSGRSGSGCNFMPFFNFLILRQRDRKWLKKTSPKKKAARSESQKLQLGGALFFLCKSDRTGTFKLFASSMYSCTAKSSQAPQIIRYSNTCFSLYKAVYNWILHSSSESKPQRQLLLFVVAEE